MSAELEEELVMVDRHAPDSPIREREPEADGQDSEASSDDDDEEEVSVGNKFKDIVRRLKEGKLDLRDPGKLQAFVLENASYLGQKTLGNGDHNTLLHLLVDDAKDKVFDIYQPLVKLLIDSYSQILSEKDSNEKTALYIAIYKKRSKLVRYICKNYKDIASILAIPCYRSENCLHVAIRRNVAPELACALIKYANETTLQAKEDKGNTPLHLAVAYDRCTDKQLEIVEALIAQCDKAMDERTNSDPPLSPYQYHEYTRIESRKAAEKEARQAAAEKEKATFQEKNEEGSTDGQTAPGKDKKFAPQTVDPKAGKSGVGSKGAAASMDAFKPGPLRRIATGMESPFVAKNTGATGHGDQLRLGTGLPMGFAGSNPGTPIAAKTDKLKKKKREPKEEPKVTEESAAVIRNYLKLYCMRTRNHDDVVDFLYGRNQENQIYFDLYDSPSKTISEDRIEEGLDHLKFEDILQYVALPSLHLEKKPATTKLRKTSRSDGKGRSDMVFLFNFLRHKKVQRIIRVIVDDMVEPAHSDEAIEAALAGFKVEIWDWRKLDLCTETILAAAFDAEEVCLYWSGNNAVLRGWSEAGGLPLLRKLKKVHLHVEQGLESSRRTENNIEDFRIRLAKLRSDVEIDVVKEQQPEKQIPTGGLIDTAHEQSEHRHRWLTCMDEFADFIQNVDTPRDLPVEPITIALIDDGVDINEQSLHAKIIGGRSFCQRDTHQNLSKPYYVTSGGHGTVMASLICRVFPKAQLYVVKLDEHISENMKRQITAKSAAKAVRAAVDKKVHIISMSWTIERTATNATDIIDLEAAIEAAARAGILMFCAANDQGVAADRSFPAACGGTKHLFKIGAAEASGTVWKWVGDPADVDFIFPGHNVIKDRPNNAPLEKCKTLTGSSVATAFAAGLAALVLYCVQLGALNTQELKDRQGNAVTMEDFKAIKGHERMKEAFTAIGTSQASGNKYIEVWDVFGPAAKKADKVGRGGRLEVVAEVARRLKTRKTLE
ncbi:hypothetical protein BKA61DRAFT_334368 [Leptodontidium sp. MPI-SDFR-AT-0119]|nr:hypothetical protein BKA61DRAFT_334368 [Leptodontidium sp. MPI-SDFR-AT-0119]